MTTLLVLGATGLVGGHLLRQALDDPRVERVVEAEAIARRMLDAAIVTTPGMHVVESDAI